MKIKKIMLGLLSTCALAGTISPVIASCGRAKDEPQVDPNIIPTDYLDISGNTLYGIKAGKDISQYNTLYIPSGINNVNANAFKNKFTYKSNIKTIKFASGFRIIESQAFAGCTGITTLDFSEFTSEDIKYLIIRDFIFEYDLRNMWYGNVKLPNLDDESIQQLKSKLLNANIPESWFVGETAGHITVEETEPKEQEVGGDSGTIAFNNITLTQEKSKNQYFTAQATVVEASEGVSVVLGEPVVDGKTASVPAELVNATKAGDYVKYKITLVCIETTSSNTNSTNNSNSSHEEVVWTETVETFKLTYKGYFEKHIQSVEFDRNKYTLGLNSTAKLNVTISPEIVVDPTLTWTTEPATQDVISLDNEGNVTALKPGSVTVRVTANDTTEGIITATCNVNVQAEGMLYFEKTGEGTCRVYGGLELYTATEDTDISIPRSTVVDGETLLVTEIAESGFEGFEHLHEVEFLDSNFCITTIGKNAFKGCTGLTAINLEHIAYERPDDPSLTPLTTIGESAFEGCSSLVDAEMIYKQGSEPQCSITTIGKNAFKDCQSLEEVEIGANVEYIGAGAFEGCQSLESASFYTPELLDQWSLLPSNYEYYYGWDVQDDDLLRFVPGSDLSANAEALTTTFKDKEWKIDTKFIYNFAFQSQSGLTSDDAICISSVHGVWLPEEVVIPANAVMNGKTLPIKAINYITSYYDYDTYGQADPFYSPFGRTKKIDLSKSNIEYIDDCAFQFAVNLEEIKFNNKIKSIGSRAFLYTALKNISIPASCTSIGGGAFTSFINEIESFTLNNSSYKYQDGMILENRNGKYDKVVSYFGNDDTVIVPEGVTEIDTYAFSLSNILYEITLPSTLEKIGERAFFYSSSLVAINFDENCPIKTLPKEMCLNCASLVDYFIPPQVETISEGCFQGTSNYNRTSGKDDLVIPQSVKVIEDYAFAAGIDNRPEYDYREWDDITDIQSVEFETDEGGNSNLQKIGNYAFYHCPINNPKILTIPKSVVSIGDHAFEAASATYGSFTILELGQDESFTSSLETIGEYAFANRPISGAWFPNTLKKIGDYAFYNNVINLLYLGPNTQIGSCTFASYTAEMNDLYIADDNGNIYLRAYVYDDDQDDWIECEYALVMANVIKNTIEVADYEIHEDSQYPVRCIASNLLISPDSQSERLEEFSETKQPLTTTIILPDNIKFICDDAFKNFNTSLSSGQFSMGSADDNLRVGLTTESNLELIGDYAFVNHPVQFFNTKGAGLAYRGPFDNLKYIGDYAFANLNVKNKTSTLTSLNQLNITIPTTIEYVGKFAFKWNELIVPVNLPENEGAFKPGCLACSYYTVNASTISENYFTDKYNVIYHIDSESKKAEAFAAPMFYYNEDGLYVAEEYFLPEKISKVADYAFYSCFGTNAIIMSEHVTEIGDHAFSVDPVLILDKSLQEIDPLEAVIVVGDEPKLDSIGDYAFAFRRNLLVAPECESLTSIGDYAFMSSGVYQYIVPEGITELNNAFFGCENLDSLTLPSTLERISLFDFGFNFDSGTTIKYNGSASEYTNKVTKGFCSDQNIIDEQQKIKSWVVKTIPEDDSKSVQDLISEVMDDILSRNIQEYIKIMYLTEVSMMMEDIWLNRQVMCADGSVSVTSMNHANAKTINDTKLIYNHYQWINMWFNMRIK